MGEWERRGQSSVLGVVLVLAIVIAGSTLTLALGAEAFASTSNHLHSGRAEQSMTQLDSQIAMVGLGSSDLQEVELAGSSSDYVVENGSGTMTVSYTNLTSSNHTTIFTQEMGAVVYENGETDIAYQGGGVWRLSEGGGATMISPPEFHYREATLTLPLVTVSGESSLATSAVVRQNNSTRYFPNRSIDENFTNPLEGSRVTVTVQSRFYEAWGEYFEERTDGNVSYDHPNNEVMIELVSPVERPNVDAATASLAASGTFRTKGNSKSACASDIYTDSYNSSGTAADYCDHRTAGNTTNNGDVVYGNSVDIEKGSGGSDIRGDIISGGSVYVGNGNGSPYVYGNISYTDSCVGGCSSRIRSGSGGSVSQIEGLDTTGSINQLVREKVETLSDSSNNTNGATNHIDSNSLDFSAVSPTDTVVLGSGQYYLNDLVVPNSNRVELDTSSGNITIAVRGRIDMAASSRIEVTGNGRVNMYVVGAGGHSFDLDMRENAYIRNDGDDAPQFRLYGMDNFTARIGEGNANLANFTGVIYAPPGSSGSGKVLINGGEVYGGIVTGTTIIPNGGSGSIHYDEALENKRVISADATVVKVTYLHVSTNHVIVESG